MKVRQVGVDGAVFDVVCDDEGRIQTVGGSQPGDELITVETVYNTGFWNRYKVTKTRRVQINPRLIAWTRLYEREHFAV